MCHGKVGTEILFALILPSVTCVLVQGGSGSVSSLGTPAQGVET